MSRVVEAIEPDTLDYQFYLNRDQTKYIVHETYTNSEAVLAHNNGVVSANPAKPSHCWLWKQH
jgi:quinol monooxygenase YgiN